MSSEDDPFGNDHFDALFIGANYPTLFGYFSLGGYEIALMKENYDSISGIFKGYVHDYAISGQAKIGELIWLTDDGQIYYYSDFVPQMKRNAVKYCLFRENSKEQYLFRQLLIELYGIAPEVIKLSDGFCVYVLESEKICNGAEVEMNGMIDQLTFRVDDDYQGEFLTMKFSYNENLVAYLLDGRQNKEILIVPDGNGDMKIAYEDAMRGKQVVIRYGRFIDQLLMYYGMIGSFASLVGMIIWIRSYRKIQEMEI